VRIGGRRLSVRTRLTLWYGGVLLAIVLVISAFSYFMLRRTLIGGADVELLMVGQVVRDAGIGEARRSEAEVREILGPRFLDVFYRVIGADGRPQAESGALRGRRLPLSAKAHKRGRSGEPTFETVSLSRGERVRLLTIPLAQELAPARFIQVGATFADIDRALAGYMETLAVMVPMGLGLALVGGAWLARSALRPVETMSRTARRIGAQDLTRRLPLRGTADELDHLAETLNAMFARLESAFTHVRRFAVDAAHELRTPLTVLKGGIEVALRADRDPAEYRDVLRSNLEEVEQLIALAENLLLLSRLRMDMALPRQAIELETLLMEVVDTGVRLASGRGVVVRLGAVEPLIVHGDPATLRRALVNLVENAIKYTKAGGKVELALERDGRHAVVAVSDTGVGMDPKDADRIFEPFVRLDSARAGEASGAGLGLSIVHSIVVAHDGRLSVQTAPGVGSTFAIRLPLV
jgi:heavy metal sensor kinase